MKSLSLTRICGGELSCSMYAIPVCSSGQFALIARINLLMKILLITSLVILLIGLISGVPLGLFILFVAAGTMSTNVHNPIFRSNGQNPSSLNLGLAVATKNMTLQINLFDLHVR